MVITLFKGMQLAYSRPHRHNIWLQSFSAVEFDKKGISPKEIVEAQLSSNLLTTMLQSSILTTMSQIILKKKKKKKKKKKTILKCFMSNIIYIITNLSYLQTSVQ